MVASACNPATREAEAGELFEPKSRRLQWAKIMSLYSNLGDESKTPSKKKKKSDMLISRPHVYRFGDVCKRYL